MCNVESALDVAVVRVLAFAVEHLAVMLVVVEVDGSVECHQDDLRRLRMRNRKALNGVGIVCIIWRAAFV